jgi:hypothetical protein
VRTPSASARLSTIRLRLLTITTVTIATATAGRAWFDGLELKDDVAIGKLAEASVMSNDETTAMTGRTDHSTLNIFQTTNAKWRIAIIRPLFIHRANDAQVH